VLVRQGRERLGRLLPGGGSRGLIVLALFALAGLGAWTAYYTVPSDSVAVVQRFGKYLEEVPPGLHFKLPLSRPPVPAILTRVLATATGKSGKPRW
jgi:membrane protease subunit HflK